MSAGGSHGSGTVDYQLYMKDFHSHLMWNYASTSYSGNVDLPNESVIDALNTALASNPYTDASRPSAAVAYDPDTDIGVVETELGEFDVLADARDPETDWEAYVDAILAKLGDASLFPDEDIIDSLATPLTAAITAATSLLTSTPITNATDSFENEQMNRFMRSVSRFAAGMADINAVNSSSFIIGIALMENEFNNQVNSFKANLQLNFYQNATTESLGKYMEAVIRRHGARDLYISQATNALMSLLSDQIKTSAMNVQLTQAQKNAKIVAKGEEATYNLDLDIKEATWDLELFQYPSAVLASIAGTGGITQKGPSKGQTALSAALSGASIGAQFSPLGAGIGAVLGGAAGYFAN